MSVWGKTSCISGINSYVEHVNLNLFAIRYQPVACYMLYLKSRRNGNFLSLLLQHFRDKDGEGIIQPDER